ncbi:MAG: hypothetical protein IPJ03_00190 [Ignavibacteriales bacterium]|nr:hypothetical protein [Ignavibacteriales bacterium]
METKEIIKQIVKLPIEDRLVVIEKALKSIREKNTKGKLGKAVAELLQEYKSNIELTVFTEIDFENFYEVR